MKFILCDMRYVIYCNRNIASKFWGRRPEFCMKNVKSPHVEVAEHKDT